MFADFLSDNEPLPDLMRQEFWLRSTLEGMRQRMAARIRQGENSLIQDIDPAIVDLQGPEIVDLT